jgi:hypothetical protein
LFVIIHSFRAEGLASTNNTNFVLLFTKLTHRNNVENSALTQGINKYTPREKAVAAAAAAHGLITNRRNIFHKHHHHRRAKKKERYHYAHHLEINLMYESVR